MEYFSWLAQEAEFSNAALTVRAQNLPPLEADRILYDIFFPGMDAPGMKLSQITTHQFRPVADRREFNARGRLIHIETPVQEELEFIPVESYFTLEEREIGEMFQRTLGNQEAIRSIIRSSYPNRVDGLVNANRRRLEMDAMRAWALGTIIARNPQTGVATTVSYGFDTDRYQTAGTAWDNGAVNAYDELLAWLVDGADVVPGGITGVVLRRNDYRAIHADAPRGLADLPLSRAQFEAQLANDLGYSLTFYILENWHDVYTGAGLTTQRQRLWPSGVVAAVPAGVAVGNMAAAPVVRAFELARQERDAEIDIRGMAVFKEIQGNGRMLTTECQVNQFPVPDEQRMWVMQSGITSSATA